MQRIGSRAQVMHGNAKMTGGGLKKKDLKYNKQGKIVSKKMSQRAKKEKRLQKAGYTTVKGQFGASKNKYNYKYNTFSSNQQIEKRKKYLGNLFIENGLNAEKASTYMKQFNMHGYSSIKLNDKIKIIDETIQQYQFRMHDYFLNKLKHIRSINILSGLNFLRYIMINKKSSLTGPYTKISEGRYIHEGFYLGQSEPTYIRRSICNLARLVGWQSQWEYCNIDNNKKNKPNDNSLLGLINCYCGQTYPTNNKFNKNMKVYFFLPKDTTISDFTTNEFNLIINHELYKRCKIIFVYGLHEYMKDLCVNLSVDTDINSENLALIYRILTVSALCSIGRNDIANDIEKYLNALNKDNTKTPFNNLKSINFDT